MNPPPNTRSAARPRNITVIQGEIEISDNPDATLTTILGSCISVCMWDPNIRVGGMNHFLLAQVTGPKSIKDGAFSMEMLINKLLRAGARRDALQAKVFGGASVSNLSNDIGQRNGEFAKSFLSNEGIACLAESIGGTKARRVRFVPTTGQAQVLFVQPTEVAPIREPAPAPANDVTLF